MKRLAHGSSLQIIGGKEGAEILFPLHDRDKVAGVDYDTIFEELRVKKGVYDEVTPDVVVASVHYAGVDKEVATVRNGKERSARNNRTLTTNLNSGMQMKSDRSGRESARSNLSSENADFDKTELLKRKYLKATRIMDQLDCFKTPILETTRKLFRGVEKMNKAELALVEEAKLFLPKFEEIDNYYKVNEEALYDNVSKAANTTQPLRNFLHNIFPNRDLDTFKTPYEKSIEDSVDESMKFALYGNQAKNPQSTIANYFGERIALYFTFLAYYRDRLILPMIFGLFLTVILVLYRSTKQLQWNTPVGSIEVDWIRILLEWSTVLYCVFIAFWTKYFITKWMRQELEFGIKFGTQNNSDSKEVRQAFEGEIVRNITNDKINDAGEIKSRVRFRIAVSIVFFLSFCIVSTLASFWLLRLKRYAIMRNWTVYSLFGFMDIDQTLGDILEYIRIQTFRKLFIKLISNMVKWQNMKYVRTHENHLIIYMGIYKLYNSACVIIIIAFTKLINDVEDMKQPNSASQGRDDLSECAQKDCTRELNYYFATYCLFHLVYMLFVKVIMVPGVRKFAFVAKRLINSSKGSKSKNVSSRPSTRSKRSLSRVSKSKQLLDQSKKEISPPVNIDQPEEENLQTSNQAHKANEIKVNTLQDFAINPKEVERKKIAEAVRMFYENPDDLYFEIDKEIDFQVKYLKDYKISEEYDQTFIDYLELFSSYSFFALFGILFPASFLIASLIGLLKWHLTKTWLTQLTRRPQPSSVSTIGLWTEMFKSVSLISIITNCFYVSFIMFEQRSLKFKFIFFLVITNTLFVCHYLIQENLSGLSHSIRRAVKRSEFIKGFLFARNLPKSSNTGKTKLSYQFEIYGKQELAKRTKSVFDVPTPRVGSFNPLSYEHSRRYQNSLERENRVRSDAQILDSHRVQEMHNQEELRYD